MRQNLLRPVLANDSTQHIVAIDQLLPRRLKKSPVVAGYVEFEIDVTADTTEREIVRAPEPIGPLDVGQREGLITRRSIRSDEKCGFFWFRCKAMPNVTAFIQNVAHPYAPYRLKTINRMTSINVLPDRQPAI